MEHIVTFSFAMIPASQNFSQESRSDSLVAIDAPIATSFAPRSINALNNRESVFDGNAVNVSAIAPIALNIINLLSGSSAARVAAAEPGHTARTDVSSH